MLEIDKLRLRLKNVDKNATEYRMTIAEARSLVKEFTALETERDILKQPTPGPILPTQPVPGPIVPTPPIRVIDGGSF